MKMKTKEKKSKYAKLDEEEIMGLYFDLMEQGDIESPEHTELVAELAARGVFVGSGELDDDCPICRAMREDEAGTGFVH